MTTIFPLASPALADLAVDATLNALDKFQREIYNNSPYRAMIDLTAQLAEIRIASGPGAWTETAHRAFREHPASEIILNDPLTQHAVARPRGYAGDAVLLDYIYEHPAMRKEVSQLSNIGAAILRHNLDSPVALAVRTRANIIASQIGASVRSDRPVEILSVASGHLREVEFLESETTRGISRLVAFDQDEASLRVVLNHRERFPAIETVQGSITEILRGRMLGRFDLIYAAGLTDYLSDRLSRRLAAALFQKLKPGGRLLFGNFLSELCDAGYMEVCMNWRLLHRNRSSILDFFRDIPATEVASMNFFTDPVRCVGYAEVERGVA